jgi:hypothetical protein
MHYVKTSSRATVYCDSGKLSVLKPTDREGEHEWG